VFPVVVIVLIAFALALSGGAVADDDPEIVELYPNPAAHGDPGEFVTIRAGEANLSGYELADDNVAVSLSNATGADASTDTVRFSTDPDRTERLTGRPAVELADRLRLADDGDRIRLLRDGVVVDEVSYDRAPRAQVYDVETDSWAPLGATEKATVSADGGEIEAFVLPDEPDRAVEFLAAARERILLAGYTISDAAVVDALVEAHERGVAVEVLADGAPVGGMGASEAAALDTLDRHGVPVSVVGGDKARYRYHHAKYAVVDDRALVTTENWNEAGLGGRSSRGWAAITEQQEVVDGLVRTFRADSGWVDAIPWDEHEPTLVDDGTATGFHPAQFERERLAVEEATLVLAPDNAEDALLDAIDAAERSIELKQVRVGDREFSLLQAVLEAAHRGVEVSVLLDSEWYVEDENREMKRWLDEQAERHDLPLSVRLVDPDESFEKIHAKGLIVDRDVTFVGSINWNENSLSHNREVGLLIRSEEVADYFGSVFESDFDPDDDDLPVGYLAVAMALAVVALVAARRLEFEHS